MTVFLVLFN